MTFSCKQILNASVPSGHGHSMSLNALYIPF